MPKGPERRAERITIRVPPSLRVALEAEAAAQLRSVSDVIILAIMKSLGVKPPKPAPVRRRATRGAK